MRDIASATRNVASPMWDVACPMPDVRSPTGVVPSPTRDVPSLMIDLPNPTQDVPSLMRKWEFFIFKNQDVLNHSALGHTVTKKTMICNDTKTKIISQG